MATLKIRNLTTGIISQDNVLYDQNANTPVTLWLEQGGQEIFTQLNAPPAVGEYQHESAVWDLFGPDGLQVVLQGNGRSINDAAIFTPTIPGRWLVRLTALQYVSADGVNVVVSDTPSVFTALYEIQDPNIIGPSDARPYGNGAVTRGASFIAPNESNEYDSDEGWARGLERYLATVSREQGFRSTVVVYNDSGAILDAGKVVCANDTDAIEGWRNTDISLENFQNSIVRVKLATAADAAIETLPKFLMTETIEIGERGIAIVEGIVPFDTSGFAVDGTTAFADGVTLYVNSLGEPSPLRPSTLDPTHTDCRLGTVVKGGADSTLTNPGSIYIHGHTSMLPGLVQGPLSSTDNAIATWDGVGGNKLRNTGVSISDLSDSGFWRIKCLAHTDSLEISSGASGDNYLKLQSGPNNSGASGYVELISGSSTDFSTGSINIRTGTAYADTAGQIYIRPGTSELTGGDVTIKGGKSETGTGGDLVLQGGTAETAGESTGFVNIIGGTNTADSTTGPVNITGGTVTLDAESILNFGSRSVSSTNIEGHEWDSVDPAGAGANEPRVRIDHDYGVSTKFRMIDTAGADSLELNSDSHSYFLNKLSIGTAAAPAGVDQLHVEGSGTFTDLTVINKLNVGGLIDPIGLIFTPTTQQSIIDGIAGVEPQVDENGGIQPHGGIFVSDGSDGLSVGDLYFQDHDGAAHNLMPGVNPGGVLIGPLAPNTTFPNQVATWVNTGGDSLQGSGITISPTGEIRSTLDAGIAHPIAITPGEHDPNIAPPDQNGADITLQSGTPIGDGSSGDVKLQAADGLNANPGSIELKAGNTQNAAPNGGGNIGIFSGTGSQDLANGTDGGVVSVVAGSGGGDGGAVYITGGSSLYTQPDVVGGNGVGGDVTIMSGLGGQQQKSGEVTLAGAPGRNGSVPNNIIGGGGGDLSLRSGNAGLQSGAQGGDIEISAGDGNCTADGANAGRGGHIRLSAGNSANAAGAILNGVAGANIFITAGNSGIGSEGVGGDVFIEAGTGDSAQADPVDGLVRICKDNVNGVQRSYMVVGDEAVSGLPGPVGVCAGAKAHTIHGHLKVTGILDPIAFLLEPQADNPIASMLSDLHGSFDVNGIQIDQDSAASQKMIQNAIWFDSGNDDRMMLGQEPVGTHGTIRYDNETVTFDAAQAIPYGDNPDGVTTGHIEADFNADVYYYDATDRIGIILVDSTLGDVAIMLPSAANYPGRSIFVKDKTGSSNTHNAGQIHIAPPSGQGLDAYQYDAPYPVQPWACVQCYSDGVDWFLI